MAKVAPSILAADFACLYNECAPVCKNSEPWLHIDVMDGVFVPNISIGPGVLNSLKAKLPDVFYDVHLMIVKPGEYVQEFAKAGASGITFHYEAEKEIEKTAAQIHKLGLKAGLSINPKTPVEEIFPYLEHIDMLLIMSVEPGFGGQSFFGQTPARIEKAKKEINKRNLNVIIEVDGGINPETAALCTKAGADVLVAGSYVFNSSNPEAAMLKLQNS